MTKMKTLLVDDEESALEGLRLRLETFADVEVIGQAMSVDEAILISNKIMPDLILLDIEMPGKSGFELLKQFQPECYPAVIFITAYHQYAVKAFDVKAVDYLLKPVNKARLQEALSRAKLRNSINDIKATLLDAGRTEPANESALPDQISYSVAQDKLVIRDGVGPVSLIPFDEIYWVDAAGDYMCIHTQNETHVMRERMKNLVTSLPVNFQRIHKSTLVNVKYIEQLTPLRNSEYQVHLRNQKTLKASRTFSKNLRKSILR